ELRKAREGKRKLQVEQTPKLQEEQARKTREEKARKAKETERKQKKVESLGQPSSHVALSPGSDQPWPHSPRRRPPPLPPPRRRQTSGPSPVTAIHTHHASSSNTERCYDPFEHKLDYAPLSVRLEQDAQAQAECARTVYAEALRTQTQPSTSSSNSPAEVAAQEYPACSPQVDTQLRYRNGKYGTKARKRGQNLGLGGNRLIKTYPLERPRPLFSPSAAQPIPR
ncbi:hypothetical protein OF83DRAFT_1179925, partial [Amylostereum chailletii]